LWFGLSSLVVYLCLLVLPVRMIVLLEGERKENKIPIYRTINNNKLSIFHGFHNPKDAPYFASRNCQRCKSRLQAKVFLKPSLSWGQWMPSHETNLAGVSNLSANTLNFQEWQAPRMGANRLNTSSFKNARHCEIRNASRSFSMVELSIPRTG